VRGRKSRGGRGVFQDVLTGSIKAFQSTARQGPAGSAVLVVSSGKRWLKGACAREERERHEKKTGQFTTRTVGEDRGVTGKRAGLRRLSPRGRAMKCRQAPGLASGRSPGIRVRLGDPEGPFGGEERLGRTRANDRGSKKIQGGVPSKGALAMNDTEMT